MAIENITRITQYRDTKTNVEALSGALEEGAISYATDTSELGIYTGGAWVWFANTTTFDPNTILTDDSGAILVDDAGNVLIGA